MKAGTRLALGAVLSGMVLAGGIGAAGLSAAGKKGPGWAELLAADQSDGWLTYGGGFDEQRFSKLTDVSDQTVSGLGLAWFHEFDTNRAQETTPLAYGGVLYVTTGLCCVMRRWDSLRESRCVGGGDAQAISTEIPYDQLERI